MLRIQLHIISLVQFFFCNSKFYLFFIAGNENSLATLELVLKRKKEELQEISTNHKRELDNRMDNYKQNPDDVLDWEDVKNDW
ncbi:addiction module protein [Psychroflexus planctonicus]|uniref:Addiction module component n=1 Tax=Psychroflexus planctonicus TaxID=1526575 RepID=A0ABQ1SED0_9FLAO|nr:addiction module protein [Psychroflexus planctonicus]GGE25737.1 hypothetical protein GCM10010832_03130 [Psychroflexus planctonicus]